MGLNNETPESGAAVCNPELRATRVRAMEYVRKRRVQLKYSQQILADKCGCHVSHICQIEKGNHRPSLELVGRLARALKCSPSRLLKGFLPDATNSGLRAGKQRIATPPRARALRAP